MKWFVAFSLFLLSVQGRPSALMPGYDELTPEEKTILAFFPKFLFELILSLEGDEINAFVSVYYQAQEQNKSMDFETELEHIRKLSESAYMKALPYVHRLKAQLAKFSPKLMIAYESIIPASLDFNHDFVQQHVIQVAQTFHGLSKGDLKVLVETFPNFVRVINDKEFKTLMKDGLHMSETEQKRLADEFIESMGKL
ncbi:hypothetical protein L596_025052 [Steinernema carpocapsae]|uniref:Fatty-acid and retinol-binding protein 1 n=1 Tax=Steinernema carpocapsae TaxID=34508 RepID=A0A4U5M6N4_STECR|nr:hypothetical protein L596_025052 [Steinernema carpocapsae]